MPHQGTAGQIGVAVRPYSDSEVDGMVRARRQVEPDASHGIAGTVVARGKCLCPFVCVKAKTTRARLGHIADQRRLRLYCGCERWREDDSGGEDGKQPAAGPPPGGRRAAAGGSA